MSLEDAHRLACEPVVPELLEPLMAEARAALDRMVAGQAWWVTPSALVDLAGWLQQSLARLTNAVILQRFTGFHLVRNPLWRPVPMPPGDAPAGSARGMLDAYVAWERGERLLADDGPYPELARLVRVARGNWGAAVAELLARVHAHRDAAARLAGVPEDALGPLTAARFGISDPHAGGRTAAVLSFGSRRVVYKPRGLDAEAAWSALAREVVLAATGLELREVGIARFDGWGLMEHLDAEPCADGDAAARCYRRYGALLALAHALGTSDLHHENVVVAGEHPIVVDAEPLFRARLALSGDGEERLRFERSLSLDGLEARESVLELGMLPMSLRSPLAPDGDEAAAEYEMGALCAYGLDPIEDLVPHGRGSDHLQMRHVEMRARSFPNLPCVDGEPRLPADHVDDVLDGFTAAHDHLRTSGGAAALDGLGATGIRVLARPTMDYSAVLARSLNPGPLRSPEARAALVRADLQQLGAARFDTVLDLAAAEEASLLEGDIPRFELRADAATSGAVALLGTPLDGARERWRQLDDFDRDLQTAAIRGRLVRPEPAPAPDAAEQAVLARALATAAGLAGAVVLRDGAPCWISASFAPGIGSTMAHADRESLYEGSAGTAVALAEAGRIAGNAEWTRIAADVFAPLMERGAAPPASAGRGGGLARGVGGLLYALVRVADATGADELLDGAVAVAAAHGERLAREDALDEVLYGRAGLLLSLLALLARRPDERVLAAARAAAEELQRRAVRSGEQAWWPGAGAAMPHVSHGASGVAMALARWARVAGDAGAAALARAALAFDDTFWREDRAGWRDLRIPDDQPGRHVTWAWCNGRSGALLARLAVAEALEEPIAGRATDALAAENADVLTEVSPGICCGTGGALDALLHVHDRTGAAGDRADRAATLLATQSPASHGSTLTPSLFTGSAGLTFALLRAARPHEVAPLLCFE